MFLHNYLFNTAIYTQQSKYKKIFTLDPNHPIHVSKVNDNTITAR